MRTGNQKPTFETVGEYAYTNGGTVIEVFEEEAGATFYPSQKDELELMLARKGDGSPAAQVIGISKPRQNGKSYAARYYAIYMADFEHRPVMYSAHHSSTTKKMFDAILDLLDNKERYPEFAKDVKRITRGRGYEGVYFKDWQDENGEWHNGGCIEFSTRTNSGARGGTYSVIVVDEAQELTTEQQEALLPTVSAASSVDDLSAMPQQIYIGTPPSPVCNGTVFSKMHQNAHSDENNGIWWMEWGIKELDDLTSETYLDLAYQTNPALGHRIAERTITSEFETMERDGFARERLGWWSPIIKHELDLALDPEAWERCKSEKTKPEGKTAYGVKFSADGSTVSLCGAVVDESGTTRVSLIEHKPTGHGTRWLSDWLNARSKKACCVVIDGRNGVDVLVDRISETWRTKGSVIRPTTKDMIASVSMLTDAVNEGTLTWYFGQDILNESAVNAIKRPMGGGYGFGGENATPIEAAALALWGVKTSKRNPAQRMRIG